MSPAIIKFFSGILLFGIGILVGLLEIIALIDPVGTKMADDADPFGNPHLPWYVHATLIVFTVCCLCFSYLLMRSAESNK